MLKRLQDQCPAHWRLYILGWILILVGSATAHLVQTSGDIRIQDLRFTGAEGRTLSALLYIPPNATSATPAPGVLAVHGYINSREVQSGFAIELARRGYVVMALDQGGHGYSDPPAFAAGFGGPAALQYLRSLDIVDENNIGLEGHSMGGWTVLAAAAAIPDGYRSVVLQGSSTGSGFAAPGTPEWPRNVSVVFAQYDEFAPLMWEVPRALDVADSGKLQTLFGTGQRVVEGQVYGDITAGTARILHSPPVTHPGNHISHAAIGHTINWFAETLEGGHPARGQIWFLKELGTLTALIGFVLLLLGSVRLLTATRLFEPLLQAPSSHAWASRSRGWWLLALAGAAIPVVTFYPFLGWGSGLLPASALKPQGITNQIVFWALLTGLILWLPGLLMRSARVQFRHDLRLSLLLALATITLAYLSVLVADFLFKVDFRFWFVGVKAMSLAQLQMMLLYLVPFTLFFLMALRALHAGLSVEDRSPWRTYVASVCIMAGGFAVFLLLQYASLFGRGLLLTPSEPLNTIIMIQFVPLMSIVALISTYTWRLTASYLPGALISGLFVSWYVVAGQATQFAS